MTPVPQVNVDVFQKPAKSPDVGLDLKGILRGLGQVKFTGSSQTAAKNVDLCGKVLDIAQAKNVMKHGKQLRVQEIVLADQ